MKTHKPCPDPFCMDCRCAALEAEKATLAKALRLTYQTHQDIHPCTLCAQMWRKLEELAAPAHADGA